MALLISRSTILDRPFCRGRTSSTKLESFDMKTIISAPRDSYASLPDHPNRFTSHQWLVSVYPTAKATPTPFHSVKGPRSQGNSALFFSLVPLRQKMSAEICVMDFVSVVITS
jgi:hypothetical protein